MYGTSTEVVVRTIRLTTVSPWGNNGHMTKGYITTAEAAQRNGLTQRRVRQLCVAGMVPGAQRFGRTWMVPAGFQWKRQRPGPKAG